METVKRRLTFEEWMQKVDAKVESVAGLSVYDLADCCFADWYDDGISSTRAAIMALENEGF